MFFDFADVTIGVSRSVLLAPNVFNLYTHYREWPKLLHAYTINLIYISVVSGAS